MEKGKGSLGGLVGSPSAFDQYLHYLPSNIARFLRDRNPTSRLVPRQATSPRAISESLQQDAAGSAPSHSMTGRVLLAEPQDYASVMASASADGLSTTLGKE